MIGVGTESVDLKKHSHSFVSFLGFDAESWGLSYNGNLQHGGVAKNYTRPFGQHSIIGIHVDLWTGTIEFYLNRKPLGKCLWFWAWASSRTHLTLRCHTVLHKKWCKFFAKCNSRYYFSQLEPGNRQCQGYQWINDTHKSVARLRLV